MKNPLFHPKAPWMQTARPVRWRRDGRHYPHAYPARPRKVMSERSGNLLLAGLFIAALMVVKPPLWLLIVGGAFWAGCVLGSDD